MMKKCACSLLFLLILYLFGAFSAQAETVGTSRGVPLKFSTPVTLEEISAAFYRYSVVAIVAELHKNDAANWNIVLNNVAQGDEDWVFEAAMCIAPGAEGQDRTDLFAALAHALTNNPEAVLTMEGGPGLSYYKMCRLPFPDQDHEFVKNYSAKTLAALDRIEDPYLFEARDLCARYLREALERWEEVGQ